MQMVVDAVQEGPCVSRDKFEEYGWVCDNKNDVVAILWDIIEDTPLTSRSLAANRAIREQAAGSPGNAQTLRGNTHTGSSRLRMQTASQLKWPMLCGQPVRL